MRETGALCGLGLTLSPGTPRPIAPTLPTPPCGLSSDPPPARSQEARNPFAWCAQLSPAISGSSRGGLEKAEREGWVIEEPGPGEVWAPGQAAPSTEEAMSREALGAAWRELRCLRSRSSPGEMEAGFRPRRFLLQPEQKLHLDPRPGGGLSPWVLSGHKYSPWRRELTWKRKGTPFGVCVRDLGQAGPELACAEQAGERPGKWAMSSGEKAGVCCVCAVCMCYVCYVNAVCVLYACAVCVM